MKQQIMDESTGIRYTLQGDYYVPNLVLPEEEYSIGKYGLLRKRFLQEYRKGTYSTLLLSGRLNEHLHEIDEQAHDFISRTVKQLAAAQGIDEALKARDQMAWVGAMNAIKAQAKEMALKKIVCGRE